MPTRCTTYRFLSVLVCALAVAALPLAAQSSNPQAPAQPPAQVPAEGASPHYPALEAAQAFLALSDDGKYSESWDAASEIFRKGVSRAQWVAAMGKVREPLGAVSERKLKGAKYTQSVPGVPVGEYVVLDFNTHFGKKKGLETVVTHLDGDGTWRVLSYAIH